MPKPKFEAENKEYFRDIHFLYEIINALKDVDEIKLFLKDLLTRAEMRMFKRRWHIACLLDQGYDMREVARRADASTQTVNNIKKILEEGRGGLKIALEKTKGKIRPEKKNISGSAAFRMGRRMIYGKDIDLE